MEILTENVPKARVPREAAGGNEEDTPSIQRIEGVCWTTVEVTVPSILLSYSTPTINYLYVLTLLLKPIVPVYRWPHLHILRQRGGSKALMHKHTERRNFPSFAAQRCPALSTIWRAYYTSPTVLTSGSSNQIDEQDGIKDACCYYRQVLSIIFLLQRYCAHHRDRKQRNAVEEDGRRDRRQTRGFQRNSSASLLLSLFSIYGSLSLRQR